MTAAIGAKVLERFPAGSPRGSWPAEEYAARRRAEGKDATVVMDLESDAFLVVVPADRGFLDGCRPPLPRSMA